MVTVNSYFFICTKVISSETNILDQSQLRLLSGNIFSGSAKIEICKSINIFQEWKNKSGVHKKVESWHKNYCIFVHFENVPKCKTLVFT